MVSEITSVQEFADAVKTSNNRIVVFDFYADWCRPCKEIAPYFNELASIHPNVGFYKVNAGNQSLDEISGACMITGLPSFLFLHNEKIVTKIVGANPELLNSTIQECSRAIENQNQDNQEAQNNNVSN